MAIDLAEFGQLGDQGAGDDIADAGHALQEIQFGAPDGLASMSLSMALLDSCALGLEPLEHGSVRALGDAVLGPGETLLLGIDHDDELTPARQQFGKPDRAVIGHRPRRRTDGLGKMGDHAASIASVLANWPSAGEFAHLPRVDDRHRQSGLGQSDSNDTLVAAAGLHNNQPRRAAASTADQLGQALAVGRATEHVPSGRTCTSTQAFDTSMPTKRSAAVLLIHHPASSMRARAQTTVRVYRNTGRRHSLPLGLEDQNDSGYRLGSASQVARPTKLCRDRRFSHDG